MTLTTLTQETLKEFERKWNDNFFALEDPNEEFDLGEYSDPEKIKSFLTTAIKKAYEEGKKEI